MLKTDELRQNKCYKILKMQSMNCVILVRRKISFLEYIYNWIIIGLISSSALIYMHRILFRLDVSAIEYMRTCRNFCKDEDERECLVRGRIALNHCIYSDSLIHIWLLAVSPLPCALFCIVSREGRPFSCIQHCRDAAKQANARSGSHKHLEWIWMGIPNMPSP